MTGGAPRPELQQIEKDFQRDVAITAARPKIVELALFAWLLLDIGLLVFFFMSVVLYLVSGTFAEQRVMASLGNNVAAIHASTIARAADPLLVGDAKVLTRETGFYDIYAVVENPNAEWYATLTYSFTNGVTTETTSASIMPGESKYLLALNVEAASRPTTVEVTVGNVVWHRVDRHAVADTEAFLAEHRNIVISDGSYDTDIVIESEAIGNSTFTLENATPYSYYNPRFIVLLERGGAVIAINVVEVPQFVAGEVREVSVRWFGDIPSGGTVTVLPDIAYFDDDVYMDPEGERDADLRDSTDDRR